MASTADIESSLEMREILQLEVQTLTKDEEALDKDISDLRVKKMELDDRIESQKSQLISGTRRLKSLNAQRLQAEYATQDANEQMDQITKSFDAKASVYARLEVEALLLEKEVEWKNDDVANWRSKRDAKCRNEEQRLGSRRKEMSRLKQEVQRVKDQVSKLKEGEGNWQSAAASRSEEKVQLNRDIRALENRNEAYRQRMRVALQDLEARISITRQRMDRTSAGRGFSQEVRWTPSKRNKIDLSEDD